MTALQDLAKFAGKAGWDILSAMLGDIIADLRKEAPNILVNRIKRTFTERRKEFMPFLDEMRLRGDDYETSAKRFDALMKEWQGEKPGEEGWRMRILVDELYGAFDPDEKPVRPERPVIPAGKGGAGTMSAPALETYKLDLRNYRADLKAWKAEAEERANLRFEFFKRLGLRSDEEIEVVLEAVRDNGFWQIVMALPIYYAKLAVKKPFKKIDEAAGKAAPHVQRLADWINAQP